MNFTWFAASYDNDNIPYRLLVFVQMTGALVLASGVESAFAHQDFTITVLGYVIMRIAGVAQWLRATASDPTHRPTALRYAVGISLCQVAWVLFLGLPAPLRVPGFVLFALAELLVPVWAERPTPTPWHAHHIQERYGLFTILVLGENVLSTTVAFQTALSDGAPDHLLGLIVGSLLVIYSLWWLYFYQSARRLIVSMRNAFIWAYGHFFVFGATAAIGAGLAVAIDQKTHHAEISFTEAGMAVAIPAAIYVVWLWILREHPHAKTLFDTLVFPVTAVLILLTPLTAQPVLLTGVLLAILVGIRLIRHLE
jgi:low temperature requirement protein LtrA